MSERWRVVMVVEGQILVLHESASKPHMFIRSTDFAFGVLVERTCDSS